MKVAIMQPYLFPYLGYFQLIKLVDCFVIYDNVQYMKGGWINRNRILYKNEAYMFTFGVSKASYQLHINERQYSTKFNDDKSKLCRLLKDAYLTAPFYNDVGILIEEVLDTTENNVANFNARSLKVICDYLGIETTFIMSSQICNYNPGFNAQERVIQIVKEVGGKEYINPIGGMQLYNKDEFNNHSLRLYFLKMKDIYYKQAENQFVPFLSIIDALMFNSKQKVNNLLEEYELI